MIHNCRYLAFFNRFTGVGRGDLAEAHRVAFATKVPATY